MKTASYILLTTLLLVHSCTTNPTTENIVRTPGVDNVKTGYKPPVFEQTDRRERIQNISEKIHELIVAHARERHIPGVAYGVVVDGKLAVASSTGLIDLEEKKPAATNSVFRIASMSKSFTAMAILKLRDEGKLGLGDPAQRYIIEMKNLNYLTADAPPITIRNLLTMSAGFPEDNPWGDRQLDETDQMLLDLVSNGAAFSTSTGFQYEYSNTGYALLGNIISQVSGIPYQDYITQNILEPLGMNETYWEFDDIPADKLVHGYRWEDEEWKGEPMLHDGSYGSMGGLFTTIEDFSKYVSYHLDAWPARNDPETGPVRRSTVREMQYATFPRLSTDSEDYNNNPCSSLVGYGFGLRTTRFCNGIWQVGHGGALPGFGSNYVFYPDYGIGLMAFGNLTYTRPYPLAELEKLVFDDAGIKKRKLPLSDILNKRKDQVLALIKSWDPELEKEILAENFFLDKDRAHRKAEIDKVLVEAGELGEPEPFRNYNELRGSLTIPAQNGSVWIYFTLSPEANPKVQQLKVERRQYR